LEAEKNPERYNGKTASKDIANFALSKLPNFVSSVDDEFLESNPLKPKVLLFSQKDSSSPLYKTLAKVFREKMMFGLIISSNSKLIERFGVKQFPKLMVVLNNQPITYSGKFTLQELQKFFVQQVKQADEIRKKDTSGVFLELNKKSKSLCPKDSFCVMFFIDAKDNTAYAPLLQEAQRRHPKFHIMWVDRIKQRFFVEVFYGGLDSDAVLVYNSKKSKFSLLEDEISNRSVELFIEKTSSGDTKWSKLEGGSPLNYLQ